MKMHHRALFRESLANMAYNDIDDNAAPNERITGFSTSPQLYILFSSSLFISLICKLVWFLFLLFQLSSHTISTARPLNVVCDNFFELEHFHITLLH